MSTGSYQKRAQQIVVPEGVRGPRSAAMGHMVGSGRGSRREPFSFCVRGVRPSWYGKPRLVCAFSSPQVWLNAFKALHGETYFFQEFSGSSLDSIATVLLVAYLVIMTIMLLNLLVAVLTTAHAKVDMNIDQEYMVSQMSRAW